MTKEKVDDNTKTEDEEGAATAVSPPLSPVATASTSGRSSISGPSPCHDKKKSRPKRSLGGGDGSLVPGAVPVAGINVETTNDVDDDDMMKDANDVESGSNDKVTTTEDATAVVEAELVVDVEESRNLEPVYDAEKIPPVEPSEGQNRNKIMIWAGVAITLLVVIILVLVGIFVIAPNNKQDEQQQQQQQQQQSPGGGSSPTSPEVVPATSSPIPTNAPTLDPNIPQWVPRGKEHITWDGMVDEVGFGVAIDMSSDGRVVAVAAPQSHHNFLLYSGEIYVYEWIDDVGGGGGGEWILRGQPMGGPEPGSLIALVGTLAMSPDGNTVAFSTTLHMDGAGLVQVYRWDEDSTEWQQLGTDLVGEQAQEQLGTSLALSEDGSALALGALLREVDESDVQGLGFDSPGPGYAQILDWDTVTQSWILRGERIDGIGNELLGTSIDLSWDGSTVAVGAFNILSRPTASDDDHGRTAVYVWNETEAAWTQLGQDIPRSSGKTKSISLSADGRTVAIVADSNLNEDFENVLGNGNARVFTFNDDDGLWTLKGDALYESELTDRYAVSLSGNGQRLALSSQLEPDSWQFFGPITVHEWNERDKKWDVIGQELWGAKESMLGHSIKLSADGSVLAAGSPLFSSDEANNTKLGRVEVYEFQTGM